MRTGGLTESPSSPPHYLAPRADGLEKDRCHFEQSAAHLFAANRRRLSREPRECQCPEKVTTDIGYEKLSVSVDERSQDGVTFHRDMAPIFHTDMAHISRVMSVDFT